MAGRKNVLRGRRGPRGSRWIVRREFEGMGPRRKEVDRSEVERNGAKRERRRTVRKVKRTTWQGRGKRTSKWRDAKTSGEGARVVCVRVCCAHGPSRLLRACGKGK